MNINKNGCTFCNEFNGKKHLSYFDETFAQKYRIEDRCLFNTNNMVCVPTLGSFKSGYILLIPKIHYLSFFELPKDIFNELKEIYDVLMDYYMDCYKSNIVIFEHGSGKACNNEAMSVTHAHQHILPYDMRLFPFVSEYEFSEFDTIEEAYIYYNKNKSQDSYLLLKDVDDKVYLSFCNDVPSQFFRIKICEQLELSDVWDWKEYPFIENMKKTIKISIQYNLKRRINNIKRKKE